jgi:hypothetical protein
MARDGKARSFHCRDQDIIELTERLDYFDQSGDGSLDGWYY